MYRRVLAFDYDGTLAEHGVVSAELQFALTQLAHADYSLFLVTGRQYDTVDLGKLADLFTGIVWENGAVLTMRGLDDVFMPFGQVDPHLVRALEQAGVPLEYGLAIVSSWSQHEKTIWHVLGDCGSDAAIVHNKGAIMISPPGAAKGSGLTRMLELTGYSPRNLVAFGDGENDLSLLNLAETGIAVADAVVGLRNVADIVTELPGAAGVLATLDTHWLAQTRTPLPPRASIKCTLGKMTKTVLSWSPALTY